MNTDWLLLIVTLPTRPAAARMRLWRTLKGLGAAALRDGAYLLPAGGEREAALAQLADSVRADDGSAELLALAAANPEQQARFVALFDRGADYAKLLAAIGRAKSEEKTARALRREFELLAAIDFFPGEAQRQAAAALAALEAAASGEPTEAAGAVRRLARADFQGRSWATRKHLWVDRMACAWLIRRFIDRKARFLWLDNPRKCPKSALGFDFDGAAFSHVGHRVSFETLIDSFGLDADPALVRLGGLVHFLDAGGAPVAEAAGLEAVLAGLKRRANDDDDALMKAAGPVFDGLYEAFTPEESP